MRQFKGLREAIPGKKGRYVGQGSYDFVIREVKITGRADNFFCAELGIIACDDAVDDQGQPFKVGDVATYMVNLAGKYPDMALGDVKAFMLGLDPDLDMDQIESSAAELVGPGQPAKGVGIHCRAITKPQRDNPDRGFTFCDWSPAARSFYVEHAEAIKAALK